MVKRNASSHTSVASASDERDMRPYGSLKRSLPKTINWDSGLIGVMSAEEVKLRLTHEKKPTENLWSADVATKLDSLADFGMSYRPTAEVVAFVETLLAKIRLAYQHKDFADERYRTFYYSSRNVMEGAALLPLPEGLKLPGLGFSMVGPSGMGRTALINRLKDILGKPFQTRLPHEAAPAQMWVIPILVLDYPACGTVQGLLSELRRVLRSELGNINTPPKVLHDLLGTDGPSAAIHLCIQLNILLIVIDGASARSMAGSSFDVLGFLLRLREHAGIPFVLSGTCAFMALASLAGSSSSNLLNGPTLHLDPIPAPEIDPEVAPKSLPGLWYQMNRWLWSLGPFSPSNQMPEALPTWTYKFAVGRMSWLIQGFEDLHQFLIKKESLRKPGDVTEAEVERVFQRRLRLHSMARKVAVSGREAEYADVALHFDHFPASFFDSSQHQKWLLQVGR